MYIKIYVSAKYMSMHRASILMQSRRRKSKLFSKISYVFKHILNYIVACQVEVRNCNWQPTTSKLTTEWIFLEGVIHHVPTYYTSLYMKYLLGHSPFYILRKLK